MGLHLVLQNIILCLFLFVGFSIYRLFFSEKKINYFVTLMLILAPAVVSCFRPGLYESGDFNIHLIRSIEFFRALSDGNIMPSWAANLNNTYGYPLFIFNYTLPYYVICFFHAVGFSFVMSMKLFLIVNFYISGVGMFLATRLLLKNEKAALAGAIFYQFAPYHLVDQNYKIPVGEIMVFSCLPVVFYCFQKLWQEKKNVWYWVTTLSLVLLIMSHALIALVSILFFWCHSLFSSFVYRDRKIVIKSSLVILVSFFGGCYVLLGSFFLSKYSIVQKLNHIRSEPGLSVRDLLFSPWRYGFLYQGPVGQINTPIGYIHLIVIILLVVSIIRYRSIKEKKNIIFFLITFLIFLFLCSSYSENLWSGYIFFVSAAQRMMIFVTFTSALLGAYFVRIIKNRKKLIWIFIGMTVLTSILNWGHRRVIAHLGDQYLYSELPASTKGVEAHWYANSKWRKVSHPWFDAVPQNPFVQNEVIKNYRVIKRNTTFHSYILLLSRNDVISENTLYFPGWSVAIDGKRVHVWPDTEGRVAFDVPVGMHYIEIIYNDILPLALLKLISVVTLLILILCIIATGNIMRITPIAKRSSLGKYFYIWKRSDKFRS